MCVNSIAYMSPPNLSLSRSWCCEHSRDGHRDKGLRGGPRPVGIPRHCIVTASERCGARPLAACLTRYFHHTMEAEVGRIDGSGEGGCTSPPAAGCSSAADQAVRITLYLCPREEGVSAGGLGSMGDCIGVQRDSAATATTATAGRGTSAVGHLEAITSPAARATTADTRSAGRSDVTPSLKGVAGCESFLACIDEAGDLLASRPFVQLVRF